jgi:biopolymer transport protein ExbD
MRIPPRPRDSGVRFNITPLIDICFNLIVFFGLASLYVKKENAQTIVLPEARQYDAHDAAASRRLVITMNADRRVFVAGEPIAREGIERLLAERIGGDPANFEVRLRADRSIPYADVKPLILACARHGVADLKFAVQALGQNVTADASRPTPR